MQRIERWRYSTISTREKWKNLMRGVDESEVTVDH